MEGLGKYSGGGFEQPVDFKRDRQANGSKGLVTLSDGAGTAWASSCIDKHVCVDFMPQRIRRMMACSGKHLKRKKAPSGIERCVPLTGCDF